MKEETEENKKSKGGKIEEFVRCAWLVKTILDYRKISFRKLCDLWEYTDWSLSGKLEPETLKRMRDYAERVFDINIEITDKDYIIENPDLLRDNVLSTWLLETCTAMNALGAVAGNRQLRDRIIVESVPSSRDHMTTIIDAMKSNQVLMMKYKSFSNDTASTYPVEPYCLRMFRRRWYMLGRSAGGKGGRPLLYGLDRIEDLQATADTFVLPDDFDAQAYFDTYYGVILDDKVRVEDIVLRANRDHKRYLRTLPLHSSQREVPGSDTGDHADFTLRLRPGYEFCQELLHAGDGIEVLKPQSLRQRMHVWVAELWDIYRDDC